MHQVELYNSALGNAGCLAILNTCYHQKTFSPCCPPLCLGHLWVYWTAGASTNCKSLLVTFLSCKKLCFVSSLVTKPAVSPGLWWGVLSEAFGQGAPARWSDSLHLPRVSAQRFLHQLHDVGICLYPKHQTSAFGLKFSIRKTVFAIAPLSA